MSMLELRNLEFDNLNDAIRILERFLNGMTWTKVANLAEMDHSVIYNWAKGTETATNLFLVQCIADVLGFDLTVRVRRGDETLADTRVDREIGALFRKLRTDQRMCENTAVIAIGGTKKSLTQFEEGQKAMEASRPLGFDRIQKLGETLGVKVTVALRRREKMPLRLKLLHQPIRGANVRYEGERKTAKAIAAGTR